MALSLLSLSVSDCSSLLPASRIAEIDHAIATHPVTLLGMAHMRCTDAALQRLESASACVHTISWTDASDPLWAYLQCKHPHEIVNGMQMHSYVYIGGEFVGNGFKLLPNAMGDADLATRLSAAGSTTCTRDCSGIAPASEIERLEEMKRQPLALLGWMSCPCTNIARSRFEADGACFVETVWAEDTAPLYKYLQCVHGSQHHSFVFFGGEFVGDGFALQADRMSDATFAAGLDRAGARRMCRRAGDQSLLGAPLQSCTQSSDGTTTGWTRSGSCAWDPSDSGYHEVCVTMSDTFLEQSARHDANDLRSVVSAGGHWCICAWAWASAVQRDPRRYEGITLECERTNQKLRDVYQSFIASGADLHSPSGAAYKAREALDAVNRLCPASAVPALPAAPSSPAAAAALAVEPSVERAQSPADARLTTAAAPTRAVSPAPFVVFALAVAAVAAGLIYRRLARRNGCEQHSAKERETLNAGAVASDVPTTPTTEAVVVDGVSLRVLE